MFAKHMTQQTALPQICIRTVYCVKNGRAQRSRVTRLTH